MCRGPRRCRQGAEARDGRVHLRQPVQLRPLFALRDGAAAHPGPQAQRLILVSGEENALSITPTPSEPPVPNSTSFAAAQHWLHTSSWLSDEYLNFSGCVGLTEVFSV